MNYLHMISIDVDKSIFIYFRFVSTKTYVSIFEIGKKREKDNPNTAQAHLISFAVSDHPSIGGGGIRTHDTFTCIHAFQACSIGRSDTPPKSLKRRAKGYLFGFYLTRKNLVGL
jgi:hypothetical protein